jgi:phage FluMu protein Com
MYINLKSWKPVVARKESVFKEDPVLYFEVELRCPVCKAINEVKSTQIYAHQCMSRGDGMHCYLQTRSIFESRNCVKCGASSVVPVAEHEPFSKDVAKRVTDQWIKRAVAELQRTEYDAEQRAYARKGKKAVTQ